MVQLQAIVWPMWETDGTWRMTVVYQEIKWVFQCTHLYPMLSPFFFFFLDLNRQGRLFKTIAMEERGKRLNSALLKRKAGEFLSTLLLCGSLSLFEGL